MLISVQSILSHIQELAPSGSVAFRLFIVVVVAFLLFASFHKSNSFTEVSRKSLFHLRAQLNAFRCAQSFSVHRNCPRSDWIGGNNDAMEKMTTTTKVTTAKHQNDIQQFRTQTKFMINGMQIVSM